MTFRRRLIIAFIMVLVLPVLLFMLSFIVIGNLVARDRNGDSPFEYRNYASLTDDYQQYSELLDSTYEKIQADLDRDPSIIEDPTYLQSLSERVSVIPISLSEKARICITQVMRSLPERTFRYCPLTATRSRMREPATT